MNSPVATKVVTLEPVEGEAAKAVRAILADRTVRVALFGGRGDVDQERAWALWRSPGPRAAWRMAARCVVSGKVVGAAAVVREEISFFIAPEWQACGYGHATVRALLELRSGSTQSPALSARTVRENQAARRILEAAGFRERGLERQDDGLPCLVRYELRAHQA
jgi:RimJ/RimL family protein N-acetyltransferase